MAVRLLHKALHSSLVASRTAGMARAVPSLLCSTQLLALPGMGSIRILGYKEMLHGTDWPAGGRNPPSRWIQQVCRLQMGLVEQSRQVAYQAILMALTERNV